VSGASSGPADQTEPTLPTPTGSGRPDRSTSGRAGRNLPVAIAVGVALAALILLSLYVVKAAFVALVTVAMLVAVWELSHALGTRGIAAPVVPLGVGTIVMIVGAYLGGSQALVVALALTVLGVIVWRLTDGPEGYVRDMTAGVFTAVYVPFLAAFAVLLLAPADGELRVTTFFLVTTFSDIGGYAAGVAFGRHAMAPAISPKKSWEGFAGSALACMAVGAASVTLFFGQEWWEGVVLGAAIALAATLGDLGESVVKRDLGVKDMGNLLPGHGGIMDRIDSLLLSAPVAWLLLAALVPVPVP
jgi:phosphatidate cytidylyltransferase